MAVNERRSRYWEWKCDGPDCEVIGRQFTKDERPPEWLSAKVTTQTVLAFHARECAERWFATRLDDGLPKVAAPPEPDMSLMENS